MMRNSKTDFGQKVLMNLLKYKNQPLLKLQKPCKLSVYKAFLQKYDAFGFIKLKA